MAPRYRLPGDVLEVAAVLEPGAGRRDVVGGALALRLEQDRQLDVVLAVPGLEGLEELEPVAVRVDHDLDARSVGGGGLERLLARVEARVGERLADGRVEAHLLAGVVGERVGAGVEVERARQRQRDDRVRAGDEAERVGVAVVALREVAVVAVHDRVQLRRVEVGAVPLPDAGTAGVGEHGAADGLEVGEEPVALDGGARLLGAGRDQELRLGAQPLGRRLAGDRRGAGDVLVGAVGARADQRRGDLQGPALGACRVADGRRAGGPGQASGAR